MAEKGADVKRMKPGLFVLLLSFFTAASYATPVSENGQLSVSGLQLVNSCGRPVQLKGISSHGLQWFGLSGCSDVCCLSASALDYVANTIGADIFRIAMYVSEGGYLTDPAKYTAQVNSLVDMCVARGIYAIIDWHILGTTTNPVGNPNNNIAEARTFWETMATAHASKNNVIYEICNEPSPTSVTWAQISTYANDIIPRIRARDPDAVIIVGTPSWSQLGAAVVAAPLSYSNIMYTFHFYAATHATTMLTNYVQQLPIFVTEWGTCSSSGSAPFDYARAPMQQE
jgi:endoglucanase